jgi:hypothetical protein
VNRMLQGDHTKQMVTQFHREWLLLPDVLSAEKPLSVNPDWTSQMAIDIFTESDTFVNKVFWNDGKLSTLFTAPYSYMNANVAAHYGMPAPAGTGFVKVDLDPTQRSGLLTLGAFLSGQAKPDQSSPILRGKFVREQILCEPVMPPPNDIIITPPMVTSDTSTRERFMMHENQILCATCHQLMDPIGFAFENFDATGMTRTMDGGKPVDTTGEVKFAIDPAVNGPFTNGVDLGKKLAGSAEVASCVSAQWFRWAMGRIEKTSDDACSLETVAKQFQASGNDMRTLPLAVMTTDAFRYRPAGGVQ